MTTEQETNLREGLQAAYPAAEPSKALRGRVAFLAAEAAPTRAQYVKRQRENRLRLLGAGATALLILTYFLSPKLTAIYALTRMASSLQGVRSFHLISWQVLPNGTRVKTDEQWYQAGNWRTESLRGGKSIVICKGGKRWTYASENNTVTLDRAAVPLGYQGITGFSITSSLLDDAAMGLHSSVEMLGEATLAGHAVHWIQTSNDKYPDTRSKLAVDNATDLPTQGESEELVNGTWKLASVREMQYDFPLANALFTPNFPKTARLIDVEAGRETWRRRLAKGIAVQELGNSAFAITYEKHNGITLPQIRPVRGPRRVVVRDFQTNTNGDVFLLYTSGCAVGEGDHLRSAELTDEYGTQYIAPTAQGSVDLVATCFDADFKNPPGNVLNGYLFNNEQLTAYWWVPLQQHGIGKPHHFTLTLREDFEPGTTVFQLPVEKSERSIVPEYMPYMARPLGSEWEIAHEEDLARAHCYRDTDLLQSLVWYERAIAVYQERGRRLGVHYDNVDEWFAIYQIKTQLGRTEEAKAALILANQDAVYASRTRDEIRAEMKKLGIDP